MVACLRGTEVRVLLQRLLHNHKRINGPSFGPNDIKKKKFLKTSTCSPRAAPSGAPGRASFGRTPKNFQSPAPHLVCLGRSPLLGGGEGAPSGPPVSPQTHPPLRRRTAEGLVACLSPPRRRLSPPDPRRIPTVSRRGQILQSGAESQRIAVRKLLNRLQHPGWYVSRLQTIRCGHTARGSYLHSGGRTPAFSGSAEFPLHGLVTGTAHRPLILPPSADRTRYR